METVFQPKILAFLCNWCSYAGADMAGVSRIQYPPSIRVIRTMCSGRVDPLFIIQALRDGFDGVMVAGCHMGDCHYQDGNVYTLRRMNMLSHLLDLSGIGKNRVHLRWASAAEAQPFADYVSEVTGIISGLGRFDSKIHQLKLDALHRSLSTQRLRWLVGIDRQVTERCNVYGKKTDPVYFQQVLQEAVVAEYQKALIHETLSKSPVSIREMSETTGLPVYTVSLRLNDLERASLVNLAGHEGTTPRFALAA
jgi:coenzyme F420-reducing hydrogenase delta subunit